MSETHLRRAMGFWDVVLFFVAAVVGLRWIATSAAAGPSSLVVWGIAFVAFFIPLAFTVIELSARYPDEGGLYVWTKRAFGDFAGFMAGWMYWMSVLVYLPGLLYFSAGNALFIGGSGWQALSDSAPYFITFSLIGVFLAMGLNIVGLGVGKWLHNAGGLGSFIPLLVLVAMGALAWARFGPATSFAPAALVPSVGLTFWIEEIVDPRRTIPRAIIVGGAMITAIYVLGTIAVLIALPKGEVSNLQGIMQAIARTADRVGFPAAGPAVALLITIGNIGGVGAWVASTARLPFVAGVDRVLPPAFGRIHPRWGTPHVALLVQAVLVAGVAVLGQAGATVSEAYDFLVSLGVISYFIPYVLMFAAVIKLGTRPIGIVLALLGMAVTLVSIVLAALPPNDSPNPTLAVVKVVGSTVALVVVGAMLFLYRRLT